MALFHQSRTARLDHHGCVLSSLPRHRCADRTPAQGRADRLAARHADGRHLAAEAGLPDRPALSDRPALRPPDHGTDAGAC